MDKAIEKLKRAWEENPLQVIFVAGIASGGAAKLLNALTSARNSHTWAKEVDRRRMKMK